MANEDARVSAQPISPGPVAASAPADGPPLTANGAPTRSAGQPTRPRTPVTEHKDGFREIIETVVFVVVLVLLLKSFAAEAFVIPTGSMAETLYGYQKQVTCPKCNYHFPVNCSSEIDPQQEALREPVVGAICPNCRYEIDFAREGINPSWNTGDRVLVAKFLYELPWRKPERHDVVVFKYPKEPQRNHTPMNYIKRLVGEPGETIGIYYGNLYRFQGLSYDDSHVKPEDLWRDRYMHENDEQAVELLKTGKFQIIRKAPDKILALRRPVFDNDYQDKSQPHRWVPEKQDGSWQPLTAEAKAFRRTAGHGPVEWLRYQHRMRNGLVELITDFMGYNTWRTPNGTHASPPPPNWVGDLLLECTVTVEQAQGQLVFELAEGVDRFQARFDLGTGVCTLVRLGDGQPERELDSKPTTVHKPGKYRLRFANVDDRLTVWVDGSLPFGDGVVYDAPAEKGPTKNDLRPASIGVQAGGVSVEGIRLYRDTYYTVNVSGPRADAPNVADWSNPGAWDELRNLPAKTLYVQPGHYLCLGDNSPESSDGRSWGLVPERLMLGRAMLVYYPFGRAGRIK